jgi:hypothetical protein
MRFSIVHGLGAPGDLANLEQSSEKVMARFA